MVRSRNDAPSFALICIRLRTDQIGQSDIRIRTLSATIELKDSDTRLVPLSLRVLAL